jgi:DeoR/GlpR family transcriptional regulator of sugar metabolism
MDLDRIDLAIEELSSNARASQAELAIRVGLSGTAIARRQRALEEKGFIEGYHGGFPSASRLFRMGSNRHTLWDLPDDGRQAIGEMRA